MRSFPQSGSRRIPPLQTHRETDRLLRLPRRRQAAWQMRTLFMLIIGIKIKDDLASNETFHSMQRFYSLWYWRITTFRAWWISMRRWSSNSCSVYLSLVQCRRARVMKHREATVANTPFETICEHRYQPKQTLHIFSPRWEHREDAAITLVWELEINQFYYSGMSLNFSIRTYFKQIPCSSIA